MNTLQLEFLMLILTGWVNRRQQNVIEYLQEENRALREQLGGKRLLFTDRQRRRLGRRCKRITLDFDPTDDPAHGQQEFTFFHGYYDTYCYLPLIGTMAFNDEKEQYLVCAIAKA